MRCAKENFFYSILLKFVIYTYIHKYIYIYTYIYIYIYIYIWPASWSSGQSLWLLIMRSRVRFPALPEGEDFHGDHGLGRWVEFRFKAPPGTTSPSITTHTPSGQLNCALWASQPQKSVTVLPCPGGRTTKSTKNMWWHWTKNNIWVWHNFIKLCITVITETKRDKV